MQKKKYSIEKKEIKRILWLCVLIISLTLLYFNLKDLNQNTYCFAKVNDKWFYGEKDKVIYFFTDNVEKRKIPMLFSNASKPNYKPTFEEMINNTNKDFIICSYGNWKNATQ